MRKIRFIFVLVLISILIAGPVWAAPKEFGKESTIRIIPQSMDMLMSGSAHIADAGNSSLSITASTYAYYPVDIIGLEISLQRWNGSSWTTINTFRYTNSNSSEINKHLGVPVLPGYSYRLMTKHYCQDGIKYESLISTTNGVTVY